MSFASDLSYGVLQQRQRRAELRPPPLDQRDGRFEPTLLAQRSAHLVLRQIDRAVPCVPETGERLVVPLEER